MFVIPCPLLVQCPQKNNLRSNVKSILGAQRRPGIETYMRWSNSQGLSRISHNVQKFCENLGHTFFANLQSLWVSNTTVGSSPLLFIEYHIPMRNYELPILDTHSCNIACPQNECALAQLGVLSPPVTKSDKKTPLK